jgi:hypothetical protein
MNTFVEISREAFEALVADNEPYTTTGAETSTLEHYTVKGVSVKAVTNYYSKAITQYYIQDINA